MRKLPAALVGLGVLSALLLWSVTRKASAAPQAEPPGPTPKPEPLSTVPEPTAPAASAVSPPYDLASLQQSGAPVTQDAIIQAARDGRLEYHWEDLPGYDGVQVFGDAARIDGVRVPVSARTTAAIAAILSDVLGAVVSPTTPLIEDILYNTADVRIRPVPQQVDSPQAVQLFSRNIDNQISQLTSGRPGWEIVSCVGKSWVLSNLSLEHPGKSINYGLHWPIGTATTNNGPWPSVDGKSKVFQQPSWAHNPDHFDYSQTLRLCKLAPGVQLPSHEPLRATELWYQMA